MLIDPATPILLGIPDHELHGGLYKALFVEILIFPPGHLTITHTLLFVLILLIRCSFVFLVKTKEMIGVKVLFGVV
jgi:membrane-bound metal-dependent hydrolase YbcI (DUF457 family)